MFKNHKDEIPPRIYVKPSVMLMSQMEMWPLVEYLMILNKDH